MPGVDCHREVLADSNPLRGDVLKERSVDSYRKVQVKGQDRSLISKRCVDSILSFLSLEWVEHSKCQNPVDSWARGINIVCFEPEADDIRRAVLHIERGAKGLGLGKSLRVFKKVGFSQSVAVVGVLPQVCVNYTDQVPVETRVKERITIWERVEGEYSSVFNRLELEVD